MTVYFKRSQVRNTKFYRNSLHFDSMSGVDYAVTKADIKLGPSQASGRRYT